MEPRLRLATLRDDAEAALYPREALDGLTTALAGFCAAFYGRQDCVWIADAGLTATCVDTDAFRLIEMSAAYPVGWRFVNDDVFDYAERRYAEGATYDLVNLDPPTNLFQQVADELELWCSLADRLVVVGSGSRTVVAEPVGWQVTDTRQRSRFAGGTFWTTLEPV